MKLTSKEFFDQSTGKPFYKMKGITEDGVRVSDDHVIDKTVELLNSLTNQQRAAVTNYVLAMAVKTYKKGFKQSGFTTIPDLRDDGERIAIDFNYTYY